MSQSNQASRRNVMTAGFGLAAAASLGASAQAAPTAKKPAASPHAANRAESGFVTTQDGVQIFYKDWGPKSAQPIVFHHGWP
ncbi:MAG: alpha/beta hydrolase, partial [Proteobacteria bacterium]|nr:alpha/beta hydrolase [Pseudomonadota bacterium]